MRATQAVLQMASALRVQHSDRIVSLTDTSTSASSSKDTQADQHGDLRMSPMGGAGPGEPAEGKRAAVEVAPMRDLEAGRRLVFLHIGMHKTASTYIQNRLRCNHDLLAKHHWLYPSLRREHLSLVQAVNQRDPRPWIHWLAQAEARNCRLLISAEALSVELAKSSPGNDGLCSGQWLLALLREQGWQVRVIAFIRDQPSYLNSRYTQLVKRLHTTSSFRKYARRVAQGNTESECDMVRLFGWILATPNLNATFIPFSGSLSSQASEQPLRNDPFEQFVAQLDLPVGLSFKAAPQSSANQQPGDMGVRLARRLGRYLKRYQPQRLKDSKACMAARKQIETWAEARQWNQIPYNGVTAPLWKEIRRNYEASNAIFVETVWGKEHSWNSIFGANPRLAAPVSQQSVDRDQLKSLLKKLLDSFPQTPA